MTNLVKMPQTDSDASLVSEIKTLIARLAAAMNEAGERDISVEFNVGKSSPDSPFTVTRLEIRKLL